MPRVYELRDLIADPSNPSSYFQDFDDSVRDEPSKKLVWLAREKEFQRLDIESWQFLKNEALPYLMTRDQKRGWQQLIAILNQARAHNYMIDKGCEAVRFIPRSKTIGEETPDIEGALDGTKVVCEVKTVSISDVEASRRKNGGVGRIAGSLDEGFFKKLMCDLRKAESQMISYAGRDAKRISFIVLNFDDFFGEYKADYFKQIDGYLMVHAVPRTDIVFYNQKMVFHCHVTMQNAVVINESG
jgi:Holliday junction resolvase